MKPIPIFDSLAHPTLSGDWLLPRYQGCAKIDDLKQKMLESNFKWAFAAGMAGVGNYDEKAFIKLFRFSDNPIFFPIAFYSPNNDSPREKLIKIKQLGYVGIKLHPRFSNFCPNNDIADIVKYASDLGLSVLLCTYCYGIGNASKLSPEIMMSFLEKIDSSKIILIHSGGVRLLEYMEIARAFPNVLLDLSLTICKYPGSSLDQDISFLFKNFDKRVCIGTDFPEFNPKTLRERFDNFSHGLSFEKLENIAYSNLFNFCGLEGFL